MFGFGSKTFALACVLAALAGSAQAVTFQGFTVTPLGSATLTVFGSDSMVVGNLGSSGNDGYSIALSPSDSGDVRVGYGQLNIPIGGFVMFTAVGTVNAVPSSDISRQRVERSGDVTYPYRVTDDLSPTGTGAVQYDLLRGSKRVYSFGVSGGVASALSTGLSNFAMPGWATSLYHPGAGPKPGTYSTDWSLVAPSYRCNDVVVDSVTETHGIPVSATAVISARTSYDMHAKGVGSLKITQIQVIPNWTTALPAAGWKGLLVMSLLLLVGGGLALRLNRARARLAA